MTVYEMWIEAKEFERLAVERRRILEDQMISDFEVKEDFEGTQNIEADGFNVKIVGRMNRKVDTELLQEIAQNENLTDHIARLFRWKAEINAGAWKNAAKEITDLLAPCVTTAPGRPSFSIEQKTGEL